MKETPPKYAERLLLWFLRSDLAEEVLGDLDEKFYAEIDRKNIRWARLNYWWQVFNYLRPFAFRKSNLFINNTIMLKHNLLISYRSFLRFKTTFFINLVGLSSGLACAMLIYLWVIDELSIDKFHKNDTHLYQVMQHIESSGMSFTTDDNSPLLGKALAEEFPEVEASTSVLEEWFRKAPGLITTKEQESVIKASEFFIEGQSFFELFSYDLLKGNEENPLPDNQSVLISDQLAEKLFRGTENVIGKTVEWEQENFTGEYAISGVFKAPPRTSTRQFDLLFPLELKAKSDSLFNQWFNSNTATYLLLKEGVDLENFNTKIKGFYSTKSENTQSEIFTQKYSAKYLFGNYINGIPTEGRFVYVILFSIIGIFILGIASINFMNLTTAKASNRLKEIGVKKAIGATRQSLIGQYFSESVLLTFMSLFVALFLVFMLLPQFNQITGKHLTLTPSLELITGCLSISLITGCLSISLITGVIAGSYPALYLSGFKPITVLKGKLKSTFGDTWIRKGLVVFQFVISTTLIIGVIVVSEQLKYIHKKDLGFNKENILQFEFKAENTAAYEAFIYEIKNIAGVQNATAYQHNMTGNYGMTDGVSWEGKPEEEFISFVTLQGGFDFVETMNIQLINGRPFDIERDQNDTKVILNESAIKAMNLANPVGKSIDLWGTSREIIGVAKDFHFASLYEEIRPCILRAIPSSNKTMVKIEEGQEFAVISAIEEVLQKRRPRLSFEYTFLDDEFKDLYGSENRIVELSRTSAIVAILISCLGLLGLTAFTTEKRKKEIGIRKVMGSSNFNIILLLTKGFTKMVVIALLIALPSGYFLASQWLQNFADQIDLNLAYFAVTTLVILGIAWLTVGLQTLRVVRLSPTNTLKEE